MNPKEWFVDGGSIFSSARGLTHTDRFTHCPVGEATKPGGWVDNVFLLYRRAGIALSHDFSRLEETSPEGMVQAVEEAHWVAEDVRSLEAEIARSAASAARGR